MLSITDRLVLRTVDGAADLLTADLRAMASIHSIHQRSADTVECTLDGPVDELAACPLYSSVEITDPDLSLKTGLLSTGGGRPAVRREPRVRAVAGRVGRGTVQFVPLAWTRRFGRYERLPWSTNLIVAEVLVRLAKIRPDQRVLDPFCGTGTILRATRRHEPTAHVTGVDHDRVALQLASRNARSVRDLCGAFQGLVEGRAEDLPLRDGSVDRVVANLPFGKQVGSHRDNQRLYPAMLEELERVVARDGRIVLLTEDKRLLRDAVQRSSFKVVRERLFRYNGATPTAYVLSRRARSR